MSKVIREVDKNILAAYEANGRNKAATAKELGITRSMLRRRLASLDERVDSGARWKLEQSASGCVFQSSDPRIKTAEDALRAANLDPAIWRAARVTVNGWDVTMTLKSGEGDKPHTVQNYQIKVVFERIVTEREENVVNALIDRLKAKSPIAPLLHKTTVRKKKGAAQRSLEICLMDPHYGMKCFTPSSDAEWSMTMCEDMVRDTLREILDLSKPYAPFDEIILPLGNDFFHTDSIWQTTTGGTPQPEAEAYLPVFVSGEHLAISILQSLKQIAPVKVYMIPGNHDRATSFMLGRVLNAYFHKDKNITVHADESPYKFHRCGVNLIGYEHGHSVTAIRLAALMANECPDDWAATKHGYREWHLGDQHRKGSSKPSVMEEQGVSVEYLPGITAPNEWHRLKSFNWQKRGTMAFVWDHKAGPVARLQVNVDRYLNCLMGRQ